MTYDARNRAISARQSPLELVTQMEYTDGFLTRITDAAGKSFSSGTTRSAGVNPKRIRMERAAIMDTTRMVS
jgi:hypothetical protein